MGDGHHEAAERRRAGQISEPENAGWKVIHEKQDPVVPELLAVLGLPGTATDDDVHRQYRTLAKEHHPDRFPDADESTREWHAEQMHRINAAYRALQDVGA